MWVGWGEVRGVNSEEVTKIKGDTLDRIRTLHLGGECGFCDN